MSILLHPITINDIDSIAAHPSQAIGLVGDQGLGKTFIACALAAKILRIDQEKVLQHPYVSIIQPVKNTIGVDESRLLTKFIKLKTAGDDEIRRVVIIEHAGVMTHEAQNAVLKLLEEPPSDTVIIMTMHTKLDVLPTIASRLQLTNVRNPAASELISQLKRNGYSDEKIQHAALMSGGLPGLAYSIVTNEATHELVQGIEIAKKFLSGDMFIRLQLIDDIVKQKQSLQVVEGLLRIAHAGLSSSAKNKSAETIVKRWHGILKLSLQAKKQLALNGQPKLVLTNLCVQMS